MGCPSCQVTKWHLERRYMLEQLANPFGVDLDAPRNSKRIDGAAAVSDHSLLHSPVVNFKSQICSGRFDVTCPWVNDHTGAADDGSAIFTNSSGSIGFRCHYGARASRTATDLLRHVEQLGSGFNQRLKHWQFTRDFNSISEMQSKAPTQEKASPPLFVAIKSCKGKHTDVRAFEDKSLVKNVNDEIVNKLKRARQRVEREDYHSVSLMNFL
jgi:hypothetical protein